MQYAHPGAATEFVILIVCGIRKREMILMQQIIRLPDVSHIICRLPLMLGWQGCPYIHMRSLVASVGCRSIATPRKRWQHWTPLRSRACGGMTAWRMAAVEPSTSLQWWLRSKGRALPGMAGLATRLQFRGSNGERQVPYFWGGMPSWRWAALRCGRRLYSRECVIKTEYGRQAFMKVCRVKQNLFLTTSL